MGQEGEVSSCKQGSVNAAWVKAGAGRFLMVRLAPGTDLIEGLEEALKKEGVLAGSVVSCIGSLREAAFHIAVPAENSIGASYSPPIKVGGPLELLSGQGTIGLGEGGGVFVHIHGVFSNGKGVIRGGHLVRGENPVLITCEIAVACLDGVQIERRYDPQVDMPVFSISRKQ